MTHSEPANFALCQKHPQEGVINGGEPYGEQC